MFLALEGGEGAGKSTQARLLAIWLREQGYDVVTTHEPGATKIGMRLRALLLDTAHTGLAPRAETLMYAADRAEHVQSVILPALERGADRGHRPVRRLLAGLPGRRARSCPVAEIAELNRWATGGLMPDLTILLDLPPVDRPGPPALSSADRLESEPVEFHQRVRSGFLSLAAADPARYLVLDAARPEAEISREIQVRVRDLLPDPVPLATEENTGSLPGGAGVTGAAGARWLTGAGGRRSTGSGALTGQEIVVDQLQRAVAARGAGEAVTVRGRSRRAADDARVAVHRAAGVRPVAGRPRLRGRAAVRPAGLRRSARPAVRSLRARTPTCCWSGPTGCRTASARPGTWCSRRRPRRSTGAGGSCCSRTPTGPPSRPRTRC